MGLFDSIANNMLGSMFGGQASGALGSIISQIMSGQHGDLGSMLGGMLNQAGGLPGIQQRAQEVGLNEVVNSWVGSGLNQSINHEQLQSLLGSEILESVASKFSIEVTQLTPLISSVLPQIVDKLTPQGQVDPALHQGDALAGAINQLMQGNGLMSIVGGLFGNRNA